MRADKLFGIFGNTEAAARPGKVSDPEKTTGKWKDGAAGNYHLLTPGEAENKQALQIMAEPYRVCLCGGDVHRIAGVRAFSVGGLHMIGGGVKYAVYTERFGVCVQCGLGYSTPEYLEDVRERVTVAKREIKMERLRATQVELDQAIEKGELSTLCRDVMKKIIEGKKSNPIKPSGTEGEY